MGAAPDMPDRIAPSRSLVEIVASGWRLLTRREQVRAAWLTIAQVLEGTLDVIAAGLTVSLVGLIVQPDLIETNVHLRRLHGLLGFASYARAVGTLAVAALVLLTLRSVVAVLVQYGVQRFAAACQTRLARELLEECVHAPYPWFLTRNSSALARLFYDDVAQWSRGFLQRLMTIADASITVATGAVLLVALAPLLGLALTVGLGGVAFAMMAVVRPRMVRLSLLKKTALERTNLAASQALTGIKDVKLSSREQYFVRMFSDSYRVASESHARLGLWQQVVPVLLPVVGLAAMMGLVLVQLRAGNTRGEIAAEMALLVLVSSRIVPAISQLSSSIGLLWNVAPFVEGLHELRRSVALSAPAPEIAQSPGSEWDGRWKELALVRVGYAYPAAPGRALREVSLALTAGGAYGVAGPSGAGKSTLVDLLLRLLDPTEGTILLDARPIGTVPRRAWQARIGYVPQAPYISDDTLRANVAFGVARDRIDDEWVMECLRRAQLAELPSGLEKGLDTPMGDRGLRVSGGQRQRIAIARALYNRPTLLVLDEATSALDRISERAIQEAVDVLRGQVTTLTIAHRLGTIRHCDAIFLFDEGRLVNVGTHGELLAQSALFRRMASDTAEEQGVAVAHAG